MSDPIQEMLDLEREIRLSHQEIFRQVAERQRRKIRFLRRRILRLRRGLSRRLRVEGRVPIRNFPP